MNNNHSSPIANGRNNRPLNSPAFSAAWGRVLGLALLALSAVPAFAGATRVLNGENQAMTRSKFSADLQRKSGSNDLITVIVQYRQMPTDAYLNTARSHGAAIHFKHHAIHAVTMRVPSSMLTELENDPNVAYVTPDRPVSMSSNPQTEEFATAVQADIAASQYGLDGTGVGVAVIDSGISAHPDLNNASGSSRVVIARALCFWTRPLGTSSDTERT